MNISDSENEPTFLFFLFTQILLDKYVSTDVDNVAANTLKYINIIRILA